MTTGIGQLGELDIGEVLLDFLEQAYRTRYRRSRAEIELWRVDYDEQRPHSALGYLTPKDFAKKVRRNAVVGKLTSIAAKCVH